MGKIDLFGLSEDEVPVVIELKVLGRNRADTPLRALLEALAYAAIVEGNASAISSEIEANTGRATTTRRPDLLIVAPTDYWEYWFDKDDSDDWLANFGILADELARSLAVDIGALGIGSPELELGLEGARPRIVSGFQTNEVAWWTGRTTPTTSEESTDH